MRADGQSTRRLQLTCDQLPDDSAYTHVSFNMLTITPFDVTQ
jgi:hypothetical protein